MGDLSKDINSKFSNAHQKALLNTIYTANWINSRQIDFFKPFGLSPQQYNILRILRGAKKPLKVQTIKNRMLQRAPNATRLMDKLCAKQLIARIASEDDRRVVLIQITPKGLTQLDAIPNTPHNDLFNKLTTSEAQTLSDLLDKLR